MSLLSDIVQAAKDSNKDWRQDIRRASFRGVPFAVYGGEGIFGRRVALHEYPGRDKPYIEDMGRSTRRIRLSGFLVSNSLVYGGGDAKAQRDAMVDAVERPGPGVLVHPTLGELIVNVPDGGLRVIERWDMGRYFELSFIFIEYGQHIFPATAPSKVSLLDKLAKKLHLSAALDFARKVIGTVGKAMSTVNTVLSTVEGVIRFGKAVVGAVVNTVAGVAEVVGRVARDMRNVTSLGSLLMGNFGRYAHGNVSSALVKSQKATNSGATIDDLLASHTQNLGAVDRASAALGTAAASLDADSGEAFTAAAQALMDALVATIPDPGIAVALLGELVSYQPVAFSSDSAIGNAQAVAQDATAALLRRGALAAMAQQVATYAPVSHDDAVALMGTVAGYLDAEILTAGDAGDDESYAALIGLRQGVVDYLSTAGATLPRLETFQFKAPMPSLVMANRLYGDAARAEELVEQADPIHPVFMPTTVKVLAS